VKITNSTRHSDERSYITRGLVYEIVVDRGKHFHSVRKRLEEIK
jgi:hypothetical protein